MDRVVEKINKQSSVAQNAFLRSHNELMCFLQIWVGFGIINNIWINRLDDSKNLCEVADSKELKSNKNNKIYLIPAVWNVLSPPEMTAKCSSKFLQVLWNMFDENLPELEETLCKALLAVCPKKIFSNKWANISGSRKKKKKKPMEEHPQRHTRWLTGCFICDDECHFFCTYTNREEKQQRGEIAISPAEVWKNLIFVSATHSDVRCISARRRKSPSKEMRHGRQRVPACFQTSTRFTENDPPPTPNANSFRRSMSPPENTNLWSYIIRLFFPSTLSFSECDWNIWVHRLRRRFIKKKKKKKFRLFVAEEPQTSTVGLKKKKTRGGKKKQFFSLSAY